MSSPPSEDEVHDANAMGMPRMVSRSLCFLAVVPLNPRIFCRNLVLSRMERILYCVPRWQLLVRGPNISSVEDWYMMEALYVQNSTVQ